MRILAGILGTLAIVAGLFLSFLAYETTIILSNAFNASAVQVTQIYSEASFYGIMAIAAFAFAAVVSLGALSVQLSQLNAATETAAARAESFYNKMNKINEK